MHVGAILNLAPTRLHPIENVLVANLDLVLEMEKLACAPQAISAITLR